MSELVKLVRASMGEGGVLTSAAFEDIVRKVFESNTKASEDVLPDDWSESFVPFVRQEGMTASTVAMLTVWSPLEGPQEIVNAIKKALTRWVGTSERGKKAWIGTCEDLNVGDLLGEGYCQDNELRKILREEGVVIAEGVIADPEEAWNYDAVLVDAGDEAVAATTEMG